MNKIIAYQLCTHTDAEEFNKQVQEYLDKGYRPLGGVAVSTAVAVAQTAENQSGCQHYIKATAPIEIRRKLFAQAMVRYV